MENIEKGGKQQQIAKFHLSYDLMGIFLITPTLRALVFKLQNHLSESVKVKNLWILRPHTQRFGFS